MLSSLYSNGVVQMILLVVTLPLWWPIVRLIRREVNAAADIADTHVRWASGQSPTAFSTNEGHGGSPVARESGRPRGANAWDAPRRFDPPVRDSADERLSIAEKVMAASERGARGFGRRPI